MSKVWIASLWASALLGTALAARFGHLDDAGAEGLFFAILMASVVGLARLRRCGGC